MKMLEQEQLNILLKNEKPSELSFEGMDLRGRNFCGSNLAGVSFKNSDLEGANLRGCNLTQANLEGANLFCANLEGAVVDNVIYDRDTKYFEMLCPPEGAFIGYKKCFNFRIVQLLIPADAKRLSATSDACRCDKAKVLSIKSADYKIIYDNACSYFDEKFEYITGKTVYSKGFCEDRWNDSSPGIHFYLTREKALGYL